MKIEAITKTKLSKKYKVAYNTFIKWIKKIPGLNLDPKQRVLTPKQVQQIIEHCGEP